MKLWAVQELAELVVVAHVEDSDLVVSVLFIVLQLRGHHTPTLLMIVRGRHFQTLPGLHLL